MLEHIINMRFEIAAVFLFAIGFMTLLHPNLIKKIIGINIMDTSIFLFLAAAGYVDGRTAPIVTGLGADPSQYINPVPSGLVLTGIVVSVSTTAFFLALTIRLYRKYNSLNLDKILLLARKGKEKV
ncbi:MAG: sodium:proton antiporter [Oscillospiraceae bacterium]|nr:sodium:proton antiporter [Oscillospiraceae bacterium]